MSQVSVPGILSLSWAWVSTHHAPAQSGRWSQREEEEPMRRRGCRRMVALWMDVQAVSAQPSPLSLSPHRARAGLCTQRAIEWTRRVQVPTWEGGPDQQHTSSSDPQQLLWDNPPHHVARKGRTWGVPLTPCQVDGRTQPAAVALRSRRRPCHQPVLFLSALRSEDLFLTPRRVKIHEYAGGIGPLRGPWCRGPSCPND